MLPKRRYILQMQKHIKEKHQADADLCMLVMKHPRRYIKQSKSAKSEILFTMPNRSKIPSKQGELP